MRQSEKPLSRLISSKSREKSAKSIASEKSYLNKSSLSNKTAVQMNETNKSEYKENNNTEKIHNEISCNVRNSNKNGPKLLNDDQNTISPILHFKENNENNISCQSIKSIKSSKIDKENSPKKEEISLKIDPEPQKLAIQLQPITYRYQKPTNKKSSKDEEFPEIRVVKSYEDKDLRQNLEQFDIEYMCRCLGLALMKHIESAKEKFHIIDLINTQKKFDFFNSIFNLNFDFFNSFLNLQNKISNLDKLDNYYKINENCTGGVNSKDMQFIKENEKGTKILEPLVSIYSHMKYGSEVDDSKTSSESEKVSENLVKADILKISSNNPNKYKNVGDKAKNILTEDLGAINEVDSMEFVQANLLFTVDQRAKKQPAQYIDLLQESATNFLADNEFKVKIIMLK
jgi:hypothetical protein